MQTINIMVVDDEYMSFKTEIESKISELSGRLDPDIDFAFIFQDRIESAEEFLNEHSSIDLIILDLLFRHSETPDKKSFDFIRFIRENDFDIPILMFSDLPEEKDILTMGFNQDFHPDDFLSKSILREGDGESRSPYEMMYEKILLLLRKFGRIKVTNGILITHGTDTMAWAFAILRYGVHDLRTNIVITGSQLPLEGAFSPSDAIGNMLTSIKLLNMMVPPNIIQVFNDGRHIFNKNLIKVKKWSVDAFAGSTFGKIEDEDLKIYEENVYTINKDKNSRLDILYFIKTGGTIDSSWTSEGLVSNEDYTTRFIQSLGNTYFKKYDDSIRVTPKDSSLFNPIDWLNVLSRIEGTGLAKADIKFDWRIFPLILSPFLTRDYYEKMADEVIANYSGVIVLGYGAGNVNIFGSTKTDSTKEDTNKYANTFGVDEYHDQFQYSFVHFLKKIELYNKKNKNDHKFVVMSSQVPFDKYDFEYQAGKIPLYYGAIPSGDLSYPEAQVKLAYILGHRELLLEIAVKTGLTYEQLVKTAFISGVRFAKARNRKEFLKISEDQCNCSLAIHKNNVFVKNSFDRALSEIVDILQ